MNNFYSLSSTSSTGKKKESVFLALSYSVNNICGGFFLFAFDQTTVQLDYYITTLKGLLLLNEYSIFVALCSLYARSYYDFNFNYIPFQRSSGEIYNPENEAM